MPSRGIRLGDGDATLQNGPIRRRLVLYVLAPPGVQEEEQQRVKAEARRTRGRLPPTAGRRSQAGGHAANTPAIPNARGGVVPQDGHVQEDARGEQHPVMAPPPRGVEVDEGGGGGGRPTDEGEGIMCSAAEHTYLPTHYMAPYARKKTEVRAKRKKRLIVGCKQAKRRRGRRWCVRLKRVAWLQPSMNDKGLGELYK
ncbi:hypothetical protein PCL_09906 [Purpureocillium lilacinum]|uniref:Uncharacterized protein n=1 Tax=Purpureocillium lilacinum TaxID=33203 RepID=A0A2U3EEE7_PURLI|nr:hypothetical protein Purlil1_1068 [Purpureocillium lilacinum]PWI72891.1 hypothetical protein PCL_09906 [Purpureocillium lilacinum]